MTKSKDLWSVFIISCMFGFIITLSFISLFDRPDIVESKTIIKLQIKLMIENNKLDSVYVYRVK